MLIKDKALKNALLKALSDEEARKILESTVGEAKSVMDLVKECDLAHTSAYRLVNEMKATGVLMVERVVITSDGKRYALYRSTFRRMTVSFESGEVEIEVQVNQGMADRLFKLFYSLPEDRERE